MESRFYEEKLSALVLDLPLRRSVRLCISLRLIQYSSGSASLLIIRRYAIISNMLERSGRARVRALVSL